VIGSGALGKLVFDGLDPAALQTGLLAQRPLSSRDPAVLMDLGWLALYAGDRARMLELQQMALRHQAVYRVGGLHGPSATPRCRVLAICAPGDLMVNTPLEFILTGSETQLDLLFVQLDQSLPAELPDHDVAFVAVAQADATEPLLRRLQALLQGWPRPVVNDPSQLLALSRPEMGTLQRGLPGVVIPPTFRAPVSDLRAWSAGAPAPCPWPWILRPVDSHAGHGLCKLENPEQLAQYLRQHKAQCSYVAPYCEFRSPDGNYRKYRVVFIEGKPFLAHLAIGRDWIVHYVTADMAEQAAHRAEEAAAMASFDTGFSRRHADALRVLAERVDLPYFGVDCGETPPGELLIFEVASAMVIHAMDSALVYPYKQDQMQRIFAAFHVLLAHTARPQPQPQRSRAWR
ncbi:MAG: ATP-grasp domain-containing protein, partial [Terriglobales bacterium]